MEQSEKLLTAVEAATLLGMRPATLARWRWAGLGPPFVKIGASVRYEPSSLREYIEQQRRWSTSDPGSARPQGDGQWRS